MKLEFKIFLNDKLIQRTIIAKRRITIGRSMDNDLVIQDQHVSRLHAIIEQEENQVRLEDRSSNGILIDGRRISVPFILPSICRLEVFPFEIECISHEDDLTLRISQGDIEASPEDDVTAQKYSQTKSCITYHFGLLIGESPQMQKIYRLIEDVADSPATVLICGEHGTGKELVARAIHEISKRREKHFIAINCSAIPLDLVESELFGYEKGAFTGAQERRKGKVEEAHGGTLFLDEIGELSLAAQAKLLRFLQERAFMRIGSAQEIPVDVRVITATNKDIHRAINEGTFRPDLYYRIKVVEINLPSLQRHTEDIPLLATHFLHEIAEVERLSSEPLLTPEALSYLREAKWPGNIRQLENLLYSAVVRSKPPYLLDLGVLLEGPSTQTSAEKEESPIDKINKELLLRILRENNWDTAKAADILKVSRGTIYYKVKKYGIDLKEASR